MRRSLSQVPRVAAIALLFLCSTRTAAQIHEVGKELKHACHSEAHLESTSDALRSALKTHDAELAAGRKLQLQLLVASAASPSGKGAKYLAPIAAVSTAVAKATAAQNRGIEAVNRAIDAIGQLKGTQAMVYAVSGLTLKGKASAQARASDPPSTGIRLGYQQVGDNEDICRETTPAQRNADASETATSGKLTLSLYALADASTTTKNNGAFLCGHSGPITGKCSDATAGDLTYFMITAGPITTAERVKYQRKTDKSDDYTAATAKSTGQLPPQKYVAARLKDVKTAELELTKLTFRAETLKDFTLTTTTEFRQAAAASVGMTLTAEQLSNPPEKLLNLIKTTFGTDQNTYDSKMWNTLADIPISKEAAGTQASTTLKELTTEEQLGKAAAYYLAKAAAAAAQANKNCGTKSDEKQQENSKTDKCKEETTERECKKDTDCEYKDGKCKLKEGVKVEEKKVEK
uniref:Variant surface glycoprotein n=1 Tax=Trypanosoma brucei TaxID=5691 RepID=A0A1V0FY71_9TRYP|nr:variant surface glycoprotein [Trypanosoma brucei]